MAFALKDAPKGKADKAKFLRQVQAYHREQDRRRLKELREKMRRIRARRDGALQTTLKKCRRRRAEVRAEVKAYREQERERINREVEAMRADAKRTCELRKATIRKAARSEQAKVRELASAERHLQRELRETERHGRRRHAALRASRAEQQQESDDRVRQNIDSELVPVFDRVKRSIKATGHKSRTEAFLQWVEENPGEVVAMQQKQADRELRELMKQEREYAKQQRARARKTRPSKADVEAYLADVPF